MDSIVYLDSVLMFSEFSKSLLRASSAALASVVVSVKVPCYFIPFYLNTLVDKALNQASICPFYCIIHNTFLDGTMLGNHR